MASAVLWFSSSLPVGASLLSRAFYFTLLFKDLIRVIVSMVGSSALLPRHVVAVYHLEYGVRHCTIV